MRGMTGVVLTSYLSWTVLTGDRRQGLPRGLVAAQLMILPSGRSNFPQSEGVI